MHKSKKITAAVTIYLLVTTLTATAAAQQPGTQSTPKPQPPSRLEKIKQMPEGTAEQLLEKMNQYRQLMEIRPESREQGMEWLKAIVTEVPRLADLFEKKYPKHEKFAKVISDKLEVMQLGVRAKVGSAKDFREEVQRVGTQYKNTDAGGYAAFWQALLNIEDGRAKLLLEPNITPKQMQQKLLGLVLEEMDKFLKAYPKHPQSAPTLWQMARVYKLQGNEQMRIKTYERLVSDYPKSQEAQEAAIALKVLHAVGKPFELKFTAVDGTKIDVQKDLKGKVVVIDFWATWCPPCVAELPNMQKLYNQYHKDGLEIIGISLDKDKKALTDFIKAQSIPWPQYCEYKGWDSEIARQWNIRAIPTMFIIDKAGVLRSTDVRGKLEQLVPKLLAEEPDAAAEPH